MINITKDLDNLIEMLGETIKIVQDLRETRNELFNATGDFCDLLIKYAEETADAPLVNMVQVFHEQIGKIMRVRTN